MSFSFVVLFFFLSREMVDMGKKLWSYDIFMPGFLMHEEEMKGRDGQRRKRAQSSVAFSFGQMELSTS